jgi:hypothetical protein
VRKKKEEREEQPAEEEVAGLDKGQRGAEQETGENGEEVEFHRGDCNAETQNSLKKPRY